MANLANSLRTAVVNNSRDANHTSDTSNASNASEPINASKSSASVNQRSSYVAVYLTLQVCCESPGAAEVRA